MSIVDAAAEQLGEHLGGVADDADADSAPALALASQGRSRRPGRGRRPPRRGSGARPGGRGGSRSTSTTRQTPVVHRDGERLRAAHAAAAAGEGERAGQGAAERASRRPRRRSRRCPGRCPGCRCRSTSRPSSGRTSSGRGARGGGTPARWPSRRRGCELAMSTRGAHSWVRMTPTGRPDWTSIVSSASSVCQGADHRVERPPVAGGAAGAAVDDEVVGTLGDLGVEVVHEHPQRGLGRPTAGGQGRAARGADRSGAIHVGRLVSRSPCAQSPNLVTGLERVRGMRGSVRGRCRTRRRGARRRRRRGGARPRSRARGSGRRPGRPHRRATRAATRPPVAGAGRSGARSWRPRAAVSSSTASTRDSASTEPGAACGRRTSPSTRGPPAWPSSGSSRPTAGAASRFISETMAAWVYCAIMWPESTPGSSARNGGRPLLRATSRNRSVRRSDMRGDVGGDDREEVEHVGRPGRRGSCRCTRPGRQGVTTGLSTAEASSHPATRAAWSTVSRAPPATCGAHRSE